MLLHAGDVDAAFHFVTRPFLDLSKGGRQLSVSARRAMRAITVNGSSCMGGILPLTSMHQWVVEGMDMLAMFSSSALMNSRKTCVCAHTHVLCEHDRGHAGCRLWRISGVHVPKTCRHGGCLQQSVNGKGWQDEMEWQDGLLVQSHVS